MSTWLVISEDLASAGTLADCLDDGNPAGSRPAARGAIPFARAGVDGLAIALGGPLRQPTLDGRGHPAAHAVVWSPWRKRSTNDLSALARGNRHLLIDWPETDAAWAMAVQAVRTVGEIAPRAARLARLVHRDSPDEHVPFTPQHGQAAEASWAIDTIYAEILSDLAPTAGRYGPVALALLTASGPLSAERAAAVLGAARVPQDVLRRLADDGLIWGEHVVRTAPAAGLAAAAIERQAPALADPATIQRLDAEIRRIREGASTMDRAIALAQRTLLDASPTGRIASPSGMVEGLVLGVCPYCPNDLRPMRTADGRLLACAGGEERGCGLRYPLPTVASVRPGGSACEACGAPMIRVKSRGWESQPRCAAALDCPDAVPQSVW